MPCWVEVPGIRWKGKGTAPTSIQTSEDASPNKNTSRWSTMIDTKLSGEPSLDANEVDCEIGLNGSDAPNC